MMTGGGVGETGGGGGGQVLGSRYMVWRGTMLIMRFKSVTVRLACKQTGTYYYTTHRGAKCAE